MITNIKNDKATHPDKPGNKKERTKNHLKPTGTDNEKLNPKSPPNMTVHARKESGFITANGNSIPKQSHHPILETKGKKQPEITHIPTQVHQEVKIKGECSQTQNTTKHSLSSTRNQLVKALEHVIRHVTTVTTIALPQQAT